MLKYLRIAVTALSLTACVLLISLWVRSYWWADLINNQILGTPIQVISVQGRLKISIPEPNPGIPKPAPAVSFETNQSEASTLARHIGQFSNSFGFGIQLEQTLGLLLPYWFPALVAGVLAAVPWLTLSRFSLRRLLIATALVAMMLGLIVAA